MAQRYDAAWMPKSLSDNVKPAQADPANKRFRVAMRDGGRFDDYGDRLTFSGRMTDAAICDMTRYAAQHRGWTAITVTGSEQFKEKAAIACALAEPPITVHGHTLSGTAATAVENTLKARRAAQAAVEAADATGADPAATAAVKSGDPLKVRSYGETLIRKAEESRKNAQTPEPTRSNDQAPSAPKPKGS